VRQHKIRLDEMTFVDFTWLVATWLDAEVLRRPLGSTPVAVFRQAVNLDSLSAASVGPKGAETD
jgi:hypothetical protein